MLTCYIKDNKALLEETTVKKESIKKWRLIHELPIFIFSNNAHKY